jgi:hypothetical protein
LGKHALRADNRRLSSAQLVVADVIYGMQLTIGGAGQLLERSLVDRTVGCVERLNIGA